jgi:hypothetical protein
VTPPGFIFLTSSDQLRPAATSRRPPLHRLRHRDSPPPLPPFSSPPQPMANLKSRQSFNPSRHGRARNLFRQDTIIVHRSQLRAKKVALQHTDFTSLLSNSYSDNICIIVCFGQTSISVIESFIVALHSVSTSIIIKKLPSVGSTMK